MTNILGDFTELVMPTPEDALVAEESSRKLASMLPGKSKSRKPLRFKIRPESAGREETVEIPLSAFRLLNGILTQMAMGNTITIVPIHAELTTQQAADLINVSRPFLIKQLQRKEIPFHKVGQHRRIKFQDLMDYKKRTDAARLKTLRELASLDQELGLE